MHTRADRQLWPSAAVTSKCRALQGCIRQGSDKMDWPAALTSSPGALCTAVVCKGAVRCLMQGCLMQGCWAGAGLQLCCAALDYSVCAVTVQGRCVHGGCSLSCRQLIDRQPAGSAGAAVFPQGPGTLLQLSHRDAPPRALQPAFPVIPGSGECMPGHGRVSPLT